MHAEPVGDQPPRTREAFTAAVEAAKAGFERVMGRAASVVVVSNVAAHQMRDWLRFPAELAGLPVIVSIRVKTDPGFLVG